MDSSAGGHVQPVYGVGLEEDIDERIVTSVEGYRGMKASLALHLLSSKSPTCP